MTGRMHQAAPVVTSSPADAALARIGVAALLQLVDWYHARGQKHQPGGSSCVSPEPPLSPPRPHRPLPPSNPSELWLALPGANREQILNALSRVELVTLFI